MLKVETKWNLNPNYMVQQNEINESIRSNLIDWLIEVHNAFKLLPETLFLTVNMIDRYFSAVQVSNREVKDYLEILSKEEVSDILKKYGVDKKEIKKWLK